jgi:ABC-type Zn2+ transport system substrate-binding protein/surface adhesin
MEEYKSQEPENNNNNDDNEDDDDDNNNNNNHNNNNNDDDDYQWENFSSCLDSSVKITISIFPQIISIRNPPCVEQQQKCVLWWSTCIF